MVSVYFKRIYNYKIIVLVLSFTDSIKPGIKCAVKFFYLDYNSCVCGTHGYSAACTLKACIPITDVGTRVNRAANDDDENVPHLGIYYRI